MSGKITSQHAAGDAALRGLLPSFQLVARLCLLALSVLTAALGVAYYQRLADAGGWALYAPLGALLGFCVLNLLWIFRRSNSSTQIYLQFSIDVLAVTVLVYLTGGLISPFLFLYPALVMAAALVLHRFAALLLVLQALAAYTLLAALLFVGWLPPAIGFGAEAPARGLLLQVVGLASAMVLLVVAVHYLRSKVWVSECLAAESQRDLRVMGEQNKVLIEDVTKLRMMEEHLRLQERMAQMLGERENSPGTAAKLPDFVGESQVMQKVFSLIARVAPSDASVLINGESGTGKELVARAIHLNSSCAAGPFVAINCGAVPENLMESLLFGHKKGSFTGAHADQSGIFQQAASGTIFLDEVGEIPLHLQAKLLRAIQEKSVRPVGGDRDLPVNVRIVSATNKNLKQEIKNNRFREDLYYRLNVIAINLPALRERREDIPLLVNTILKRLVKGAQVPVVSPAAMQALMSYDYKGNVRELENLLERAVVLGGRVILPEHLPEALTQAAAAGRGDSSETEIIIDESIEFPVKLDDVLAMIERRYLESALNETNGVKKKAAELLGINFRSFRYRLQKFGIAE